MIQSLTQNASSPFKIFSKGEEKKTSQKRANIYRMVASCIIYS